MALIGKHHGAADDESRAVLCRVVSASSSKQLNSTEPDPRVFVSGVSGPPSYQ